MKSKAKVIISTPIADNDAMRALTAQAIAGACIGAKDEVIDMVLRRSCDIAANRVWLVKNAIKAGATHILFVDADMVFPYDIIPRLLKSGKEIIGVEYNKREFPLKMLCEPLEERKTDEIYKVKYTGTGLLLIDLSVFEKFRGAWFRFERNADGELVLGEDVFFCNEARQAGYDVFVDPTIKVGHLGEYAY